MRFRFARYVLKRRNQHLIQLPLALTVTGSVWDPICPLSKPKRVCGQAKTALGEILNAGLVQRAIGEVQNKLDPE